VFGIIKDLKPLFWFYFNCPPNICLSDNNLLTSVLVCVCIQLEIFQGTDFSYIDTDLFNVQRSSLRRIKEIRVRVCLGLIHTILK